MYNREVAEPGFGKMLELLVYNHIDFLERRLYAEKQHRKCFEMRYREDVPFLEGAPAHAR